MQTFLFVVLSWIGVSLILGVRYGASIGAAKRAQLNHWRAIRRNAWQQGLGVRS